MSYQSTILADSPLRYYRLSETSGTVVTDLGSQAQNGTLHGGVSLSQSSLLAGDANTSMLFNGSTGYISLPTTGLPTGANAFSLECWVKLGTLNTYQTIMEFGTFNGTGNQGVRLDYGGGFGNAFAFDNVDYSMGSVFSTATLTQNSFYHLVCTYDGTTAKLYVNGVFQTSQNQTLALALAAATIGGQDATDFGAWWWASLIDEVAIYSTCLSPARVTAHYTAGIYALVTPGRALFRIGIHRVLSITLARPVQHINVTLSEVAMTTPNTTIDSSATVKDQNGAVVSNLSAYALSVSYQDGTSATPAVSNMGGGIYTASYNTKGAGTLTETWSFTDTSGALAQEQRTLVIAY